MTIQILSAVGGGYTEIHQSYPLKYTFLSPGEESTYQEVAVPFKCRDYLNDILYYEERKKPFCVYNFTNSNLKGNISRDKTRLAVYFPDKDREKQTLENLGFLNEIEKSNELELTTLTPTNFPLVYMVEGDSYWLSATYLISFYTSYLRWLGYPLVVGELVSQQLLKTTRGCTDADHIRMYKCEDRMAFFEQNVRCLDDLLKNEEVGVFSYKKIDYDIYAVHNSGGILGTMMKSERHSSIYGETFEAIYTGQLKCAA